jgi:cysteine-rich repeat protein
MYVRSRFGTVILVLAIAMLTTLGTIRRAHAHALPALPLALWGPFATPTVDCLRQLSQATRRCFSATLAAHRSCMDTALAGNTCDTAERDTVIVAARETASAAVDAACLGGQLVELRFSDANDARTDVLLACAEAETAMRTVYGPVLNTVTAPALSPADRACITHVGMAASKMLSATLREESRVFDAAAVRILPPSQKLALLSGARQRLTTARQHMAGHMSKPCAGATVYDRHPEQLLSMLDRRGACVLSAVYFHTSVICPSPICGDGIVDTGEECDDGNGIDVDGCLGDCTLQ